MVKINVVNPVSDRWGTQALPSSGAIPILQSFCENNNQDSNETHHFKHINEEGYVLWALACFLVEL